MIVMEDMETHTYKIQKLINLQTNKNKGPNPMVQKKHRFWDNDFLFSKFCKIFS